ncbi:DUF6262 family protein [Nocardia paucivorans]|uniref:DUF6262 family protein n=1 Tax=Nocardia paucivorans TaxID=114259 RepID=UPI00031F736F|nr:DUF6262 family protein [Nocardia paucivorans]
MKTLPDHLRAATIRRTQHAAQQAHAALEKMVKYNQPISFTAVAREAGVSTDFLYRHPQLRPEIERYRAKSEPAAPPRGSDSDPTGSSSAVRALARKLEDERRTHHAQVSELRKALEAAHGENLELRRRLALHEPD